MNAKELYKEIEKREPIAQGKLLKELHPEAYCQECEGVLDEQALELTQSNLRYLIGRNCISYDVNWKFVTEKAP